jgi:Na+-transporting NADH:ubiquinone oxidoreductase subunit E
MGIGFQSFGGMLTGGDEAPAEVDNTTAQELKMEDKKEMEKDLTTDKAEALEKEVSFNDITNN